jgi:hypothetical protein
VYLVDTNVISARVPSKGFPPDELVGWMDAASPKLFISVVTTGEVIAGIAKALREGATTKASGCQSCRSAPRQGSKHRSITWVGGYCHCRYCQSSWAHSADPQLEAF